MLEGGDEEAALALAIAEEDPDAAFLLQENERPEDAFVPPGAEFAWAAFWHLQHDRSYLTTGVATQMGVVSIEARPGRIPFAAVDRYAQRFGITGEAFSFLWALISRIDAAYVAWRAEQMAARAAQS